MKQLYIKRAANAAHQTLSRTGRGLCPPLCKGQQSVWLTVLRSDKRAIVQAATAAQAASDFILAAATSMRAAA